MKFIDLRCPNCNATLEIEDTLDTCYCKYCGTKIMITEQDKDVLNAKIRIHEIDAETQRERDRLEHERKMAERPGCLKTITDFYLSFIKLSIVMVLVGILMLIVMELFGY